MYVDVFFVEYNYPMLLFVQAKKKYIRFFILGVLSLSLANVWSHKVKKVYTLYIETLLGFFGH